MFLIGGETGLLRRGKRDMDTMDRMDAMDSIQATAQSYAKYANERLLGFERRESD